MHCAVFVIYVFCSVLTPVCPCDVVIDVNVIVITSQCVGLDIIMRSWGMYLFEFFIFNIDDAICARTVSCSNTAISWISYLADASVV